MTPAILTLDHLSRSYGDVRAVDDICLDIRKGEFISFLGPSGSGKTTTLSMVAGLTEPTSGKIILDGKDVTKLPPYSRNLGMVFQSYALFPHMTIRQNLAFPLETRRLPKAEISKQVGEALELVGLPDVASRYPKQLSGGQQQRVALARALIYRPPVLLMDEPLGALDKKLRMQMQFEIKKLHREISTTILYVTHDQEEALTMSDRVVVFNRGRLEQVGTPNALYESPASKFVADFIGTTTLLEGRVIEANCDICAISVGELTVMGRGGDSLAAGEQVAISIRPERIRRISPEAIGNGAVLGHISECVYLGGSRQLLVKLIDGPNIMVTEQISTASSCPPKLGDLVGLEWNANDAVVLKS